jgi:manganese-dependent ADP-ribose/CDP-alcohol diphosphatase
MKGYSKKTQRGRGSPSWSRLFGSGLVVSNYDVQLMQKLSFIILLFGCQFLFAQTTPATQAVAHEVTAEKRQKGIDRAGEKNDTAEEDFAFGLIADCQYCAVEGTGVRKYSMSDQKLQQCVSHFNTLDLEYVVHLGDFIDRDYESFAVVGPVYQQLNMPAYHVLGNHDFSVADKLKKKVPRTMGLKRRYYDFAVEGWRFLVLDGNDISYHAYPENSRQYRAADAYYRENQIESPKWNGAIGKKQLKWIEQTLQKACGAGEKVVFYCHFPVYPTNVHNLWNAPAVVALIESYDCIKAYINGHNHQGNYASKAGVHYLTLKGMVDTAESAYAVMKIWPDRLELEGFGREENRVMVIRK